MEQQRIKKPTLSLRKNIPAPSHPAKGDSTPILQDQHPDNLSQFTQERFQEWNIPVVEDVEPKRRKRRKDKHVEQYRKEARWQ
ncbi:hypothetical protein D9M71_718660 [compost metagenome]